MDEDLDRRITRLEEWVKNHEDFAEHRTQYYDKLIEKLDERDDKLNKSLDVMKQQMNRVRYFGLGIAFVVSLAWAVFEIAIRVMK